MTISIDEFIYKLENPQVYTGREINAVRTPFNKEDVNICLVFPDTYEIGMSHYGMQILYHLLNAMEGVRAERCFLPVKGSVDTFKEYDVPLFSLENKRPIKEFDLIGFSLLSEMTFTNVLKVLELAQIPLRREARRHSDYPVIAAGGISACNPEPLRDFIDVFAMGDGETIFPDIVEVLKKYKKNPSSDGKHLEDFRDVPGLYVPELSPLEKIGRFYVPQVKGKTIRKQVIKELESSRSIPENKIIAPITNVVFNRLTIEIARGCPQNCRFCQAKTYYAPYRTQSPVHTITNIEEGLKNTGFDVFSLASLSAGDYPWMEELLRKIPCLISTGTSFSLPSLRPSTLSGDLLSTISLFRRTGITIVPEAGTERLRRVINKNVTDEEIFTAVELAIKHNWQKIKLYFMIGLPTETMEDIDGIIKLIGSIKERAHAVRKKIKIHASFSSFVPKPHTPLQYAARESLSSLRNKINYLKHHLKKTKNLDLDIHLPNKGVVETILARGDYRVGRLLEDAMHKGEIFCAWDSDFHFQEWLALIDAEGAPYREFLAEFSPQETLPWDFIDINYKNEYMQAEYKKATEAVETPACDQMDCGQCKGCFYGMKREIAASGLTGNETGNETGSDTGSDAPPVRQDQPRDESPATAYNQVRIFYEKSGDFAFLSHLSMMKHVERLIRMTGIPFKCSEGFHPRMKITALPPLPVFASGLQDVVEVFLDNSFSKEVILERLQRVGNENGLPFKNVEFYNHSRPLPKDIHFLGFCVSVPGVMDYAADDEKRETLKQLLAETDHLSWDADGMILEMDYAHGGQERFGKIYRLLDPEKQHTRHLARISVRFKEPVPPMEG